MAQESLSELAQRLLSKTHQLTALGKYLDAAPGQVVAVPPGISMEQLAHFVMAEVSTLEAIAVRFARELDELRTTPKAA